MNHVAGLQEKPEVLFQGLVNHDCDEAEREQDSDEKLRDSEEGSRSRKCCVCGKDALLLRRCTREREMGGEGRGV